MAVLHSGGSDVDCVAERVDARWPLRLRVSVRLLHASRHATYASAGGDPLRRLVF